MRSVLGGVALSALAAGTVWADDAAPDYSANLFGNMNGFRDAFAKAGGTLNLTESSEVFANPFGGVKQGADYDGLTTLTIQLDTEKAFGLKGGQFNASLLQLHGDNYTPRYIGALQTISGIQGDRATRLWELWYDQKFGDNFDIKFGQQSLDNEFANHPSAGYFVNSLFGWPALHALDMPDGGAAFPLASLGVRAKGTSGPWTVMGGVFSGRPSTNDDPDPQSANRYGVRFPLDGVFAIAEGQYAIGQGDGQYAGVYKLGAWYDSLSFNDLRYNIFGQPLGDPAVDPTARTHHGDFGLYAVGEQMVWRGKEKEQTLSLFLRPQFAPQGDRNLTTFSINGGMALRDPLPGRADDTFVLGFGVVQLSPSAIGVTEDAAFYNPGVYTPKGSYESVIEASYQYQVTKWAQIQPDLQYIHNPGGGVANPNAQTEKVHDALVGGLRLNITF